MSVLQSSQIIDVSFLFARSANLAEFVEDDSVDHVDVLPDGYSVDTPSRHRQKSVWHVSSGPLQTEWSENRKWEVRC